MWLGSILVLGGLIFMFALPRDVGPSVVRYLMWIIPLGIGAWALTQDFLEREQRSLPLSDAWTAPTRTLRAISDVKRRRPTRSQTLTTPSHPVAVEEYV